ncbi:MAG: hypothetical protein QXM22_06880, partial [Candidatus Bathyarchaeia archaeon]
MELSGFARERILSVLMAHRHRLALRTVETYNSALVRLARLVDLDNVPAVERIIPTLPRKGISPFIAAYKLYCQHHRLPQPQILVHIERRRTLPKIPPETVLQASLVVPRRKKWRAYLRLLYETGARSSEPFFLQVGEIRPCLEKEKIRLGTIKYGGDTVERELPISPLLTSMLK